jgi:decaprenyl-phosphate phosphoribosyltransferase
VRSPSPARVTRAVDATAAVGATSTAQRAHSKWRVVLRACRPRQWAKNMLAFAAPCAAGWLDRPEIAARAFGAFAVLCMISSATYLVNDVRDVQQDRLHPRKRLRPIAAGELSTGAALKIAAALAVLGVAGGTAITAGLGLLAVGYLVLTASYSLWLRRVAVFDIVIISAGFVLRAAAGGVATDIYLSRWFMLVTACCAVFLVAAKRYAELRALGASATRQSLRRYSAQHLRIVLGVSSGLAAVAYTSWAFTRPGHTVWYALSIVPLVLWLGRYMTLIARGGGQAPEELILRDHALLTLGAIWSALFLGGVYVGG